MSIWSGRLGAQPRQRRRARRGDLAPLDVRDHVNRALAAELGLSAAHRDHLLDVRGLPPQALDCFATLPELGGAERRALAAAVIRRVGRTPAGVPGFWRDGKSWVVVPLPTGFLVPVPDGRGRVLGFQLRLDAPAPGQPRYVQLSSANWAHGTSSGVPASVWRPDQRDAGSTIVEGHLKAAIGAYHLPACTIGVAGVANWRPALEVLRGAPAGYPVTIAYDAPDFVEVREVWDARERLALALHGAGYAVRVATWDGARAKGIDDALLAGLDIDVALWAPSLGPLRRPASRTLPSIERPSAIELVAS